MDERQHRRGRDDESPVVEGHEGRGGDQRDQDRCAHERNEGGQAHQEAPDDGIGQAQQGEHRGRNRRDAGIDDRQRKKVVADPLVDIAHHARQPHPRGERQRDTQKLATVIVAMHQQHEGQHGGIAELQQDAWCRTGELTQQRLAVLHNDLLDGRSGRACRRRGSRGFLDLLGDLLDSRDRLAHARELLLQPVREDRRIGDPARDRGNGQRQQAGQHKRQQRHRAGGGQYLRDVHPLKCTGDRHQHQRQHDRTGGGNEEVAREIAHDADGAHRQHDQGAADRRAATQVDGRHAHSQFFFSQFFGQFFGHPNLADRHQRGMRRLVAGDNPGTSGNP